MKALWRGRIVRYTPLFLWIAMVLLLSTADASMSRTSRFIRPLLEFLFPEATETTLIQYHSIIRKCAHIFEYAVLGFLASRVYIGSAVTGLRRYWPAAAFFTAAAVALTDEFNQSLDPARTGSVFDIFVDLSAAFVAIMALVVFNHFSKIDKTENHPV